MSFEVDTCATQTLPKKEVRVALSRASSSVCFNVYTSFANIIKLHAVMQYISFGGWGGVRGEREAEFLRSVWGTPLASGPGGPL